jgi:hypothetical protein
LNRVLRFQRWETAKRENSIRQCSMHLTALRFPVASGDSGLEGFYGEAVGFGDDKDAVEVVRETSLCVVDIEDGRTNRSGLTHIGLRATTDVGRSLVFGTAGV